MKTLDRLLKTGVWTLFLLGSTLIIIILLNKPRSVAEFYASLLQIDGFYLLLAMIGSLIVASVITVLGQQES